MQLPRQMYVFFCACCLIYWGWGGGGVLLLIWLFDDAQYIMLQTQALPEEERSKLELKGITTQSNLLRVGQHSKCFHVKNRITVQLDDASQIIPLVFFLFCWFILVDMANQVFIDMLSRMRF